MFARVACALTMLFALAPAAHALRCGNRLVETGDYDAQVRDRCGDPYWVEDRYQLIANGDPSVQTVTQVTYTAWFYNFGPDRLLVRLLFRDGRLAREDTLDRGVDEIGDSCGPGRLVSGMSGGEIVAYCGMPMSRNAQTGALVRRIGPGTYRQTDLAQEDWIYDIGGNFLYVLHLLNGRVTSVDHIPR